MPDQDTELTKMAGPVTEPSKASGQYDDKIKILDILANQSKTVKQDRLPYSCSTVNIIYCGSSLSVSFIYLFIFRTTYRTKLHL